MNPLDKKIKPNPKYSKVVSSVLVARVNLIKCTGRANNQHWKQPKEGAWKIRGGENPNFVQKDFNFSLKLSLQVQLFYKFRNDEIFRRINVNNLVRITHIYNEMNDGG